MSIKIIVVDDHPMLRSGFAALIKNDDSLQLIAEASNAEEALKKIQKHKPDLAVIDIDLPDMSGLELSSIIKETCPETDILILTGFKNEEYIIEAMDIDVSGYFLKEETDDLLIPAIKKIHNGETVLSPKVLNYWTKILKKKSKFAEDIPELKKLTARELEILKLIAENKTSIEIGDKLFIDKKTVESHRNNIRKKLNLTGGGKNALLLFAIQNRYSLP
jgi:DNA-binding NarL/FixJ family response regulator